MLVRFRSVTFPVALVALLAVLFTAGCIPTTVGANFTKYNFDRAAFEMHCPRDQVEARVLNGGVQDPLFAGAQVGLTGCGERRVYVLDPMFGWILRVE